MVILHLQCAQWSADVPCQTQQSLQENRMDERISVTGPKEKPIPSIGYGSCNIHAAVSFGANRFPFFGGDILMKTRILAIPVAVLLGATGIRQAPTATAQQIRPSNTGVDSTQSNTSSQQFKTTHSPNHQQLSQLDKRTSGANIRASKLIGMNLQNDQGQSVGEIDDLVIDGNTGKIRYAAVKYGGFLGVGDKLFAVPFEAFKVQPERGSQNEYVLTLDVSKNQLKNAQGFDKDNWPNFADRNFTNEVDRQYGIDRSAMRRSSEGPPSGSQPRSR
jgi:sporulation protein YlmC with PRC-barrel domain